MTSKPQINVALVLKGEGFLPEQITSIIDLKPTATWRAGDPVQGTKLRRKNDAWVFSLEYRETYDMDALLRELLHSLEPYLEKILEVSKALGLTRELSFGVYVGQQTPTSWFAADTIRRIAELEADLDIDLILTN